MKSYKQVLNEASAYGQLRELTESERNKLKQTFLNAFADINKVCIENNIKVMLIGGTLLGSIRHRGFIPWDDDFDLAISREDFEKLKLLFDSELGDKYLLIAPNYKGVTKQRFPQILIRDTELITIEEIGVDLPKEIAIDLFIIENVPENIVHRYLKGIMCTGLMFIAGQVQTYQWRNDVLLNYLSQTDEGAKVYKRRLKIGKMFSFITFDKWFNIVDKNVNFKYHSALSSIPTGRKHYFGEMLKTNCFFPVINGEFEGIDVFIPNGYDEYLKNMYGDYMKIPPPEKREKHFICDICFHD